ncbi:hypothetical protein [Pseudomonas sp. RIT-To-2]|uniref:hypothetical protein n=1 Tax=Pseudomonas sp. RIT-To-2 TaxID=3462541 RepID=UPI0024133F6F
MRAGWWRAWTMLAPALVSQSAYHLAWAFYAGGMVMGLFALLMWALSRSTAYGECLYRDGVAAHQPLSQPSPNRV